MPPKPKDKTRNDLQEDVVECTGPGPGEAESGSEEVVEGDDRQQATNADPSQKDQQKGKTAPKGAKGNVAAAAAEDGYPSDGSDDGSMQRKRGRPPTKPATIAKRKAAAEAEKSATIKAKKRQTPDAADAADAAEADDEKIAGGPRGKKCVLASRKSAFQ